ncbi:MAG: hypothetical protein AAFV80_24415, partial [Bacteroidota bacterium]
PDPDEEKIKGDLIGRSILGWDFNYLSEFKDIRILKKNKGKNRIEYILDLQLYNRSDRTDHDCEVNVVYNKGGSDWYLNSVQLNYITYEYQLYANRWTKIRPVLNAKWTVRTPDKVAWKKYKGNYGKEYYTGPGTSGTTLPYSTTYYLKPVDNINSTAKFTYRRY